MINENGKQKVCFAVLGLGIGMAHAEAITTSEYAHLACACDINEKRREKFSARFPGVRVYDNFDDMIKDESVDVICVCLPTYMHADYARKVLAAGKHCLVEKPADITADRARDLGDCAKTAGKKLGFVFQNRFNYCMYPIYEAIRNGRMGQIFLGTFAVKWLRKQSYYDKDGGWRGTWDKDGGGSLINQSIHTVDLMLTLMGSEVESVSSAGGIYGHNIETEDATASVIKFKNGSMATFVSTTCAYNGLSTEVGIYGTGGSIECDADKIVRWRLRDDEDGIEEEEILDAYGMGNLFASVKHEGVRCGHGYMIDDMAKAVLEDRDPVISLDEALKSLSLIEKIYENIR